MITKDKIRAVVNVLLGSLFLINAYRYSQYEVDRKLYISGLIVLGIILVAIGLTDLFKKEKL